MENLTDSFKNMRVRRVLFDQSADSDKEDIMKNCHTGLSKRRSFSVGEVCLQDEDFYPSEVGKMMILEDQLQDMEARSMQENVNACSAWELNFEVPFQDFSRSVNRQCQELFGDYRSFNDCSRLYTSTPVSSQKFTTFRAHLATKDNIFNYHHEVGNKRDSGLFPMLLNTYYSSTTAATAFNAFKIVGTANTQTLGAGEIPKETFGACSGNFKGNHSNFQSLDSSIRSGEHINVRIPSQNVARNLNGDELWNVDPQVLTLDVKGKGRLQLINNSLTRNLKFKIEFNSKLITVCPAMGSVKSKSKIGLRVIDVSRGVNNNVVMEDVIRITCGNIEKEVPVQIYKFQKEKTFKNRSFRCF